MVKKAPPFFGGTAAYSHQELRRIMLELRFHGWVVVVSHLNEKRAPGWLRYIGDEILPSYMGIIINHYKEPI